MNIAVTGDKGFIGTHLCNALLHEGHNVIGIDCSNDRESMDYMVLPTWTMPCDLIFHLASPVGCRKVLLEPHVYSNIILGAAAAIECAERIGAKLVMFSSAEVDDAVLSPNDKRSEYPRGKLELERMCHWSPYEDIVIVRPHNVVGPGQSAEAGSVLPRFIEAKRQGKPLPIFGTGYQERIFTSVHDVVDFCLLLMKRWPETKRPFELANPKNCVSINRLANIIGGPVEYTSGEKEYGVKKYRDMPSRNFANINQALNLGWKPKWDLNRIIEELTNEHRNDRSQPTTADEADNRVSVR